MKDFVHLHLHTHYSLLDGAIRIPDLMERIGELGMDTVAMTDHGNLYGAVNFQKAAQKAGLKSIIGCEMYMCDAAFDEDRFGADVFHLTLLAQNLEGYKNLMYLNSMGWLKGFDERRGIPRIDFDLLAEHHRGLICLSGDLGSEVNQALLGGARQQAVETISRYRDLFGPQRYYLEVMQNALPEQQQCTEAVVELSREMDVELVATNDCHYLTREDARAHAVLMCIQLGKTADVERMMDHGVDQLYVRSAEEMWEAFKDLPEACENTRKIADMCDVEIPLGDIYLPRYDVPESFVEERQVDDNEAIDLYFEHVAKEGLEERFREFDELGLEYDRPVYEERLREEIEIIREMEFPGYFLIVWDFIDWSHNQGIPVGPGRGSGAGSLVAYSMRITDIDPMPYDLLFERFLNPERVSMPDFDIDFCMNRRGEVIEYVTEKYGTDNVGQIITYGQMKARACIKDVGRALNFSFGETNRIAKLVPDELGITLDEALAKESRLRKKCDDEERVDTLFDIALSLENMNRQAGIHAAGLVIADDPLWEYVPICRGANGEIVTQYAKDEVEEAGLVKFDFLGLKTLTVIDDAVRLINQQREDRGEEPFDLQSIPLDDPAVFELISAGNTTGVFQLESSGFQELLKKLKPNAFEDIVAAVALYRPGPLGSGMVDDFIDRKHGRKKVEYPHPWLEEVLEPTYGVMVYQEQVMKTAQVMAGYTLGGADLLRRAMGKKKEKVMAEQKQIFVDGAVDKGVDQAKAAEIFDLMAYFAGYGFNKSHSAAYGLITYQTGYLKAHYPVEFMAALMTSDRDNTDKIVRFINEAEEMGIEVLPPDVNESLLDFSVVDGKIRFGLAAIKGVGAGVIEVILEERSRGGPFESLYDFCSRVDRESINKRALEAMVKSGAFDSIGPPLSQQHIGAICEARASIFDAIDAAVERGARAQHDAEVGQSNLFGMMTEEVRDEVLDESYPEAAPWSERELLGYERELLGFYVTGHPLDRFESELGIYGVTAAQDLINGNLRNRTTVVAAGVVSTMREISLKSGDGRMAFVTLEDKTGGVEVILFSSVYEEYEEVVKSGDPLLIRGMIQEEGDPENRTRRIKCDEVTTLMAQREEKISRIEVEIGVEDVDNGQLEALRRILERHRGDCRTSLVFRMQTGQGWGTAELPLPSGFSARPSDELMMSIERLFGRESVSLR